MVHISSGWEGFTKRFMVFVDGTNLLVQMSKVIEVGFRAEKPPASAFALAQHLITAASSAKGGYKYDTIRKYWFASYQGNDEMHTQLCQDLRKHNFEPVLFNKRGKNKEKGVDIALTMEMLVNAFNGNFDVGLLIAGDEDYVELVREVKRYGPIVVGAFFSKGLSERLKLEFDGFQLLPEHMQDKPLRTLVANIEDEVKKRKKHA